MSTSAYTYFQSLRGIVATQTTTNKPVSQYFHLIAKHVCQRERELHLLDHIELASILATQLGSKSEAILLRERVLRDAVAEKDELVHRRIEEGQEGFLDGGKSIYICW